MTVKKFLRKIDNLSYPHANRLHFKNSKATSTACGGACTILVALGVIAIAV